MKLVKTCKIELVVSQDSTRYTLAQAYLEGDKLVATDGRRIVVLPVIREVGDDDGYISPEALMRARKLAKKEVYSTIGANGGLKLKDGAMLPRQTLDQGGRFPNWKQVIPSDMDRTGDKVVAFDAKMLWEMAQAMGCEKVRITIKDDCAPIMVYPIGAAKDFEPGTRGVLMPVKCS